MGDVKGVRDSLKFRRSWHISLKSESSEVRKTGFPGGTVVKNLPANAGNTSSSPGPGRSNMPRSN